MSASIAHIYRHPIKGIGSEALEHADLSPEGALRGDRAWALLNEAAPDLDEWQPRRNFLQVAAGPKLALVSAASGSTEISLSHPEKDDLILEPAKDGRALSDWLADLWPSDRPAPARLVKAPGHGMTDMPQPYVSIGNLSTLRAVSGRAGRALDMRRFRINLWVEGLAPWEEFDLVDQDITIGAVTLSGAERIGRCRAPEANPETGVRDVNTNKVLQEGWGHTDFGIYMTVKAAGTVSVADTVSISWN